MYLIETLNRYGIWEVVEDATENTFAAEEDANAMIGQLRTIGDDWANAEYRVVLAAFSVCPR